ncbi:MAG TPA: deoxyribose-phosphate aldolase [Burkholderiaceae bacterium]|nr:deoxyribose-phosphate aldolase [Burkholderiaceae bacterium]
MTTRTALDAARIALACLDLTSLNDGDSEADVHALCERASGRHGAVAAVCVWPRFARLARQRLSLAVKVAAVANFPDGSTDVARTEREVDTIVQAGAQEVDVVLPWRALLVGGEATCVAVLRAARHGSRGLTLKVILETGELRDEAAIERASRLALGEGADFLKTSTGKTPVSATPQAAAVMLRVIASDPATRSRVGFKASGGIRTVAGAVPYLDAVAQALGAAALTPARFRIGASSLLADIEAVLDGAPRASAEPSGDTY